MGFIPKALMRSTVDSAGKPDGIQALTFQDGGVPIYKHHFYVDSSPRTSDVDLNSAGVKGGAPDWRTIVVGGLGKGGSSYYALDLTDPDAIDEAAAAGKVLWEVTDTDWKYTYGRPIIVKTYAYGWTVIVTSGYNNVSGEGRIYLLNPATGQPHDITKPYLTTGPVSCTGPDGTPQQSGLAQINGFTKDFHNQFVEQVYGGDLCGNLWRFDLPITGAYQHRSVRTYRRRRAALRSRSRRHRRSRSTSRTARPVLFIGGPAARPDRSGRSQAGAAADDVCDP
jgi:type IV pilus assembly protein PilY1